MSKVATSPKTPEKRLDENILEPVDRLAEAMAKRRQADVKTLTNMATERNEVLFDGQWLSAAEAKRAHQKMRAKSWLTILELILAVILVVMFAGIILGVLSIVGGVILQH